MRFRRDARHYIILGVLVVNVLWGIFDLIFGNVDFIIDRFYIAAIALAVLFCYRQLKITPFILCVGLIPVILHDIALYESHFILPYDHYVHFTAGLAIGMVVYNYMHSIERNHLRAFLVAVCVTAGVGSFMEIIEFLGYTIGGEGGGILFYGAGDLGEWNNAVRDMIMNTFGAMVGSFLMYTKES